MTGPAVPPPLPFVPAAPGSPVDRSRQAVTEAEKARDLARAAAHQRAFELDRLAETLESLKASSDLDGLSEVVKRRAALEAELAELNNMTSRRDLEVETRRTQAERMERQALIQIELVKHEQAQLDHQVNQVVELRRQADLVESTLYAAEERVANARADLIRLVGEVV